MLIVREIKTNNKATYLMEFIDDNTRKVIFSQIVLHEVLYCKKENRQYIVIYDTNMTLVTNAYDFLNHSMDTLALNSRTKAATALSLLFDYQVIIGKELQTFDINDFKSLILFLRGTPINGLFKKWDLETLRQNSTIDGYLSVYRTYAKFLGVNSGPLFDRIFLPPTDVSGRTSRYSLQLKVPDAEVKAYISVDEYIKLIKCVRAHNDIEAECIIRLEYECGLRIGEILGLTADDLQSNVKINREYQTIIYLRNRISDLPCQKCKRLLQVFSYPDYKTKEYNTEEVGYQKIVVPQPLFILLDDYIEEFHILARKKHSKRYYSKTVADRVRPAVPGEDTNYYIFINSIGTPLRQDVWDRKLRTLYDECDILLDYGVKSSNLNHRLRHGFAMYHTKILKTDSITLQKLMRHKSLKSTTIYFSPSLEDKANLKDAFAESLYKDFPALLDIDYRKT